MINPMDYAHSFTELDVEFLELIKILLDTAFKILDKVIVTVINLGHAETFFSMF